MLVMVMWLLLAAISLPLALLALVLWPLVWLLSLPLRLIGISVRAVFQLLEAIMGLPARLVGGRAR